ncbi:alpha-catulin-like [Tachypleus tridentatus]|uniref:alpha-catulin-like n=1 Tax=Tachypleus tridentatus TaxID=6853 RepID=UPI003FD3DCB3
MHSRRAVPSIGNAKEKPNYDKTGRTLLRIGQAINIAVERFVTVGEYIAEDNPEIKVDMFEACKDARSTVLLIEELCEAQRGEPSNTRHFVEKTRLARAARGLLTSITRVLILADTVVVKQLLRTKDRQKLEMAVISRASEILKRFSSCIPCSALRCTLQASTLVNGGARAMMLHSLKALYRMENMNEEPQRRNRKYDDRYSHRIESEREK